MIITSTLFVICHSFHLSVTDIFINKENKAEIVFTLFVDDLEKAINTNGNFENIDLLNEESYLDQKTILNQYIAHSCELKTLNGNVSLHYLGHEIKGNRCLIYLESLTPIIDEITFSNRLLMDVFKDQKNLIQFEYRKKKETALFEDNEDVFHLHLR